MAIIIPSDLNDYGRKVYNLVLRCNAQDNGARLRGDVEVLINDGMLDVTGINASFNHFEDIEAMVIDLSTTLSESTTIITGIKATMRQAFNGNPTIYRPGIYGTNVVGLICERWDDDPDLIINPDMYYFILHLSYIKL